MEISLSANIEMLPNFRKKYFHLNASQWQVSLVGGHERREGKLFILYGEWRYLHLSGKQYSVSTLQGTGPLLHYYTLPANNRTTVHSTSQ